jgi:hypothetical protein
MEIHFFIILKEGGPRSSCLQVWFIPGLSYWLMGGNLLIVSSHSLSPEHTSLASLSVSTFPPLVRSPVRLEQNPL